MKELTKAEEQIMQVLWGLGKGFVKDVIDRLPDPKPAYNTVSTIVRILERKGFVSYKAFGKTHQYYPLLTKDEYKKDFLNSFVKNYFSNSYKDMVSFFARDENFTARELEDIRNLINEALRDQKRDNDE